MIKVFQKIRYDLMEKNKTGKPALPVGRYLKYAIGEIILVMIGILLALQVNNWNQKRLAFNKEKTLLLELHQEFIENKKQFDLVISKHQEALKACDALIAMFPIDPKTVNLDSIPDREDGMYRRWTFNPSQGIINSLISTSSFELISNRELRKLLVSWNDVLMDFQEDEIGSKKYVMEVFNPFMKKHFHYTLGYSDSRLDISVLASPVFENIIYGRKEHIVDILGREDDEFSRIQNTLDQIIELSKPDAQ